MTNEKYLITRLFYNESYKRKNITHPTEVFSFIIEKYYDSFEEARKIVKQLAQKEYKALTAFAKIVEMNWFFEINLDGPYEVVIKKYYDPPSKNDRDYVNIIEYYITPVAERNDNECLVVYIDQLNGQHLHFIHAQYTSENLSFGTDCAVYYDITDEFGNEFDGGQMDFNTKEQGYTNILEAIPDLIEFRYGKHPETKDFEVLEYANNPAK